MQALTTKLKLYCSIGLIGMAILPTGLGTTDTRSDGYVCGYNLLLSEVHGRSLNLYGCII